MRRFSVILTLLALLALWPLTPAASSSLEEEYVKNRNEYNKFLENIELQRQRPQWNKHLERFVLFAKNHPDHERAPNSLYLAGDAYARLARWSGLPEDAREAVKTFDRVAVVYPNHPLADDALFRAAELLEIKLVKPDEAFLLYRAVVNDYPDGDQADEAEEGLVRLREYALPGEELPEVVEPSLEEIEISEEPVEIKDDAVVIEPTPEPEPVVIEPTPVPEPEPVVIEPTPVPEPEPVVIESTPVPEPEPVVIEPTPVPEPEPVVIEPTPATEPEPVEIEPTPVPEPEPVVVEPTPAPEPEPVVIEPTPVPESKPVEKSAVAPESEKESATPPEGITEQPVILTVPPESVPAPTAANTIRRVEYLAGDNRGLLAIHLDRPAAVEHSARQPAAGVNEPGVIKITLFDVTLAPDAAAPAETAGPVRSVVVQELDGAVEIRLVTGPYRGYRVNLSSDPCRLIVEIQGAASPENHSALPPRQAVVVIDPGHGGWDNGAECDQLLEKDVVLTLTQMIGRKLADQPNIKVIFTRENDAYLPLDARFALANDVGADLLVSLHINASELPHAEGIESYIYRSPDNGNGNGETIVTFENQAGGADRHEPHPQLPPELRLRLQESSQRLAEAIHYRLLPRIRLARPQATDRGIKKGPLFLLSGARVPAVLIEVGFATNAEEVRWLQQPSYLEKIADGVVQGILDYLPTRPSPGE